MFYQHELLTKRSGSGLSLVWLLSTLGNKCTFGKKVSKKDVLRQDVSLVCQTVISPPEPLALRLSASLLLGTARLYGQQVTLFAGDCERLQTALKKAIIDMAKPIATNLDMNTNAARKDAITVAFPDVELGLDAMNLGMDDYAFLLFDEQTTGQGDAGPDDEAGFTTQDLFLEEPEEDAYIPPGSGKKRAAKQKGKGKQRATDPPSDAAPRKANNTLNDNELNLLQEDDFAPFVDPNELSAQQDYAEFMGDGFDNQPMFDLNADHDLVGPDFSRNSRTGGGSTNAGGFDLGLDFGFDELLPPLSGRPRAGSVAARGRSQTAPLVDFDQQDAQPGFFDQLDNNQMDLDPPRSATPRDEEESIEKDNTSGVSEKKPKKATRKPKKGAAILDRTITLKDQDVATTRAAYSAMIKKETIEAAEKADEKLQAESARELVFGIPSFFAAAPELTELWNALGPKYRKRSDDVADLPSKRKRARKDQGSPNAEDVEAETGRDAAVNELEDYDQGYMQDLNPNAGYQRGQSQDVELGRAASRAGSAAPSRFDETMPWNGSALDQGDAPSRGDVSQLSGGRLSFRAETPLSARRRQSSRPGSVAPDYPSPAALAQRHSRGGSMTGHESLDLRLDAGGYDEPMADGEAFTFDESELSQAALAAKVQQESINFLAYAKRQSNLEGELLFSDIAPVSATGQKVAAQAFYQVLVLASKSLLKIVRTDEIGEIHLSVG